MQWYTGDVSSSKPSRWRLERVLFAMAGSVALVSAGVAAFVSPWFLLLTAIAGVNQWLFAAFGACPAAFVLQRLGPRSCASPDEVTR